MVHTIKISKYNWPGIILKLFVFMVYLFLFTPIFVVILLSFTENISIITLKGLTLKWYQKLWEDFYVIKSLLFSIQLGITCAIISVVIGTMAAFGLVRHSFKGKSIIQTALFSPMVLPEIITAVAVLSFFALLRLPRSYLTLVIGHTLLILPYVISMVSARLYGFDRSLEEVALNLGASPFRMMIEITLPLLAPAIIGGALIAFKISFDNVIGALFWCSLKKQTLPVLVFAMLKFELTPEVNAIGTTIIIITLSCMSFFQLISFKKTGITSKFL
jgi:spermidine/putrescine transport system permease protein